MFKQSFESEKNQEATIYIGNLDPEVTENLLYELFVQFSPVRSVSLPKDKILKTHQGFGFVELVSATSVDYVIRVLGGIQLFGKVVKVKRSNVDKTKTMDVGANLFLNNLDSLIDERFLYDTFHKFGEFAKPPHVVTDPVTGTSKGYGFISLTEFEAADKVIEMMNNQFLMNKPITVEYSLKSNGKDRHGDEVERLMAASAKKHNYDFNNGSIFRMPQQRATENPEASDVGRGIGVPRGARRGYRDA
ncbi:hypothetical protein BABINDRAFT_163784 [Babjeviella inositovora NRRL Y-12698]|uniref:RRM domain-containing protein n=1 Tax=Babjeviella inositovora NRRL Y-12698 TaxID=984486 RepID=A0A1E3QH87_9ASCO|nr:uncharacterized protein BABINDRAFT_163784 [Babjeviella inositovora NRRL Y-12698]ODQ77051.1 hypothetical protein BABINDRAFT_163784 [Babjeviella inositovora NRRL Y-12698]